MSSSYNQNSRSIWRRPLPRKVCIGPQRKNPAQVENYAEPFVIPSNLAIPVCISGLCEILRPRKTGLFFSPLLRAEAEPPRNKPHICVRYHPSLGNTVTGCFLTSIIQGPLTLNLTLTMGGVTRLDRLPHLGSESIDEDIGGSTER